MKIKNIKQFLTVVIFSLIPSLLSYLAHSSLVFDKMIKYGFLGNSINILLIQDCCLLIGILLSALLLSFNLFRTKVKYEQMIEERNSLIKMVKSILSSALGKRFTSDPSSFDIRFFIPKHPFIYRLADHFHFSRIKVKFIIKNVDLIADQGLTNNLQFEVSPHQEGLVGICYNTKSMIMDDDLEKTNETKYNLKQIQIDRTSNLKWSICCPILDDNDKVVAILALDGQSKITIDPAKENELKQDILSFSRLFYSSVPQLFRR